MPPQHEVSEVYLDWNSTTPPLPGVLLAMAEAAERAWANPASIHGAGRRARGMVDGAREELAHVLRLHPRDVLLTSGGTEANNLALRDARGLVTSRLEHPSVVRVAEFLESQGIPVRWAPVPTSGQLDPLAISELLGELAPGATVAVTAVNHETGTVQPVAAISDLVHARGGRLHVDAVQALGRLGSEAWAGADTVAVAAHKIRGPKGIGALGVLPGIVPRPVLLGGAQERGLRPGTQCASLAAGFQVAAQHAQKSVAVYAGLAALRDAIDAGLTAMGELNGAEGPRAPHVTNLSFAGWRGDELVAALDLMGICVSSGSACSAGTAEASPVITAMVGVERARSAVRISLGELTGWAHVERLLAALRQVLGR